MYLRSNWFQLHWPLEKALEDELKLDKKETNTKGRRVVDIRKSSSRHHRGMGRREVACIPRPDLTSQESDYCDMKPSIIKEHWSQAGEDMASLISFGSLPSSSGGSGDMYTCGSLTRDMDPSLRTLFKSNLSDEDILKKLISWTSEDSPGSSSRYRNGCLPYLINLLHLHPLHTETARPTRNIRQVRVFILIFSIKELKVFRLLFHRFVSYLDNRHLFSNLNSLRRMCY